MNKSYEEIGNGNNLAVGRRGLQCPAGTEIGDSSIHASFSSICEEDIHSCDAIFSSFLVMIDIMTAKKGKGKSANELTHKIFVQ